MKTKHLMFAAMVAMLALTSCHHKELCYLHPHEVALMLEFDWKEAPEADPAGMCVFFYHENSDVAPVRFDFSGMEGGEISLIPGAYRVLAYNNDTEAVLTGGSGDFDQHYAYTREGNILEPIYGNHLPIPPRGDDERVMIAPDDMWGCSDVHILVTGTENQVITLFPHDLLCHYSYEVRNVKNLKHVSQMSAALSGMAPSMALASEELHTEPVTLPFGARQDGENRIVGEFLTFGHHLDVPSPHRMSFYMVMDDGSKYSFTTGSSLDVTDQVHSAQNPRRVHLIIDGLDLPTPIENGSGFDPVVDDWDDIQQDIEM
ncbi:MAG: DUF5119 domain-containing protein [Clostridium sp.]|nr:DUF5119 domain-containing protein [Clostridium sp.]